jgi:hypothetical protein
MKQEKITYFFHNAAHVGDCLVSLHFLKKLVSKNNILCEFQCDLENSHGYSVYDGKENSQLKEFISDTESVQITNHNHPNSINLHWDPAVWRMKNFNLGIPAIENYGYAEETISMWFHVYNFIAQENGLVPPFETLDDVYFDGVLFNHSDKYESYDYLITNGKPGSDQLAFSDERRQEFFEIICDVLYENNKTFITTEKVKDYPSTRDLGLSLCQIGNLAQNCKNVIGVPNSPFIMSMNKKALLKCKRYIAIRHKPITINFRTKIYNLNPEDITIQILLGE